MCMYDDDENTEERIKDDEWINVRFDCFACPTYNYFVTPVFILYIFNDSDDPENSR